MFLIVALKTQQLVYLHTHEFRFSFIPWNGDIWVLTRIVWSQVVYNITGHRSPWKSLLQIMAASFSIPECIPMTLSRPIYRQGHSRNNLISLHCKNIYSSGILSLAIKVWSFMRKVVHHGRPDYLIATCFCLKIKVPTYWIWCEMSHFNLMGVK